MPPRNKPIILTKSDGETDTLRNWAKRTGLASTTIMYRINTKGMSIDDALNPDSGKLFLTIDGETLSTVEWSKKTGILSGTIKNRMKNGWTDSQVLGFSPPPETMGFQGEFLKQAQIARKLGISAEALRQRIKKGWNPKLALMEEDWENEFLSPGRSVGSHLTQAAVSHYLKKHDVAAEQLFATAVYQAYLNGVRHPKVLVRAFGITSTTAVKIPSPH